MSTARRCLLALAVALAAPCAATAAPMEQQLQALALSRAELDLVTRSVPIRNLRPFDAVQQQFGPVVAGEPPLLRVVHLWAVECKVCLAELPIVLNMARAHQRYFKGKSSQFLLLSESDDNAVRSYVAEHAADFEHTTVYKADGRLLRQALGTSSQPVTLLLDRRGIVRHAFVGSLLYRRHQFATIIRRVWSSVAAEN